MSYSEDQECTGTGLEMLKFKYKILKLQAAQENNSGNAVYHAYELKKMRYGTRKSTEVDLCGRRSAAF